MIITILFYIVMIEVGV